MVKQFFMAHLALVYFLYGLAFFSMGLAIALETRRESQLKLRLILPWLAAYGLVHSANEWLDMLALQKKYADNMVLSSTRITVLTISTILIVVFGSELIGRLGGYKWVRLTPFFLGGLWLLQFLILKNHFIFNTTNAIEVSVYYCLYFPGNILASLGLYLQYKELSTEHLKKIAKNFAIAAILFLAIGVFEGLITVPPISFFPANIINENTFLAITDIPAQVIRGILALLITIFIIRGLRIFEEESRKKVSILEEKRRITDVLQAGLLPEKIPDIKNIKIGSRYESATLEAAIGGDFYDFITLKKGIGIVVGDVSGKGIEMASDAFFARSVTRCYGHQEFKPSELLFNLNNALQKQLNANNFVTAFYCILQPQTGQITYANGGHHFPIIYRKGKTLIFLEESGAALGNFENERYHEANFFLEKDDILLIYTDGLVEARKNSHLFGEKKVIDLLQKYSNLEAQNIADKITEDAISFSKNILKDDIITLVLKKVA